MVEKPKKGFVMSLSSLSVLTISIVRLEDSRTRILGSPRYCRCQVGDASNITL